MRIIGGQAARHTLKVPKGYDVRPTPDRVKQAVFNSLGGRFNEARVLELFAGSGALGLEFLSRGATHVTSVEKSGKVVRMIRLNLANLGLDEARFELREQDAFAAITQLRTTRRQFDLIVADPPYGEKNVGCRSKSFAQQLLDNENLPHLLNPEGLFILGHTKRDTLDFPAEWAEANTLKHGDTVMRFLSRATQQASETIAS
ncbi:MAG: 16S rRNA (guanine(966)-N(2))-methyltransferase RsmD [Pedosphaera sp.]|nr:16S rRNA (guanine(966)-N(2))-methyltransferase RsmD [Pedosphaera sp.]